MNLLLIISNCARIPSISGQLGRGPNNLVSKPLEPVLKVSGERGSSNHGYEDGSPENHSVLEVSGWVLALEGTIHHHKFDKLLEELVTSRGGTKPSIGRSAMADSQTPVVSQNPSSLSAQ